MIFIYIPPCEQNRNIFSQFVKILTERSHSILTMNNSKPKNNFSHLFKIFLPPEARGGVDPY